MSSGRKIALKLCLEQVMPEADTYPEMKHLRLIGIAKGYSALFDYMIQRQCPQPIFDNDEVPQSTAADRCYRFFDNDAFKGTQPISGADNLTDGDPDHYITGTVQKMTSVRLMLEGKDENEDGLCEECFNHIESEGEINEIMLALSFYFKILNCSPVREIKHAYYLYADAMKRLEALSKGKLAIENDAMLVLTNSAYEYNLGKKKRRLPLVSMFQFPPRDVWNLYPRVNDYNGLPEYMRDLFPLAHTFKLEINYLNVAPEILNDAESNANAKFYSNIGYAKCKAALFDYLISFKYNEEFYNKRKSLNNGYENAAKRCLFFFENNAFNYEDPKITNASQIENYFLRLEVDNMIDKYLAGFDLYETIFCDVKGEEEEEDEEKDEEKDIIYALVIYFHILVRPPHDKHKVAAYKKYKDAMEFLQSKSNGKLLIEYDSILVYTEEGSEDSSGRRLPLVSVRQFTIEKAEAFFSLLREETFLAKPERHYFTYPPPYFKRR